MRHPKAKLYYLIDQKSALQIAGTKMVSYYPWDSMQSIDLGVSKSILNAIISNTDKLINLMEKDLLKCISLTSTEFSRVPRSFDDFYRFKATEMRH